MEKEEKEKKNQKENKKSNKLLTTLLVILLLISFLGIGFAIGSTQLLKEVRKNNNVNESKEKTKNISIVDENVSEAIKSFQQIGLEPEEVLESDVTKLTKKELIITALKGLAFEQINYCKNNENDLSIPISIDDLNKSLKKAVPDGKISLEDIRNNANDTTSYSIGGYGYTFKYFNGTKEEYAIKIIDKNIYVIGPCGHEGPNETIIETKIEKAEKTGESLYIYQKVAYGKTEFSTAMDSFVYDYYKDKEYKIKEETKATNEEPTWSQYNTYIITFKENGNNYYFASSKIQ